MSGYPQMTHWDRARRRERVVAAYQRGRSSRAVAADFGMNDSYVRWIVREAGIARRPGQPGLQTFTERSANG